MREFLRQPRDHLSPLQIRWLKPLASWQRALRGALIEINAVCVRILFRLRVEKSASSPLRTPFIIAPNHSSSLDGAVLFAALDRDVWRRTRWIGREGAVLRHPLRRAVNRLARTMPVRRNASALAAASVVLSQGENLVWFPEGSRTITGELQPLKPGIGLLMKEFAAPVLPVYIDGAYAAMPPGRWLPRLFRTITVRIGEPIDAVERGGASAEDVQIVEGNVDAVATALRRLRDDKSAHLSTVE